MKRYAGIDIGTANIKLVEVEVDKNNVKIARVFNMPSPERSILSDSKLDQDELSSQLKKALVTAGIKTKKVIVSLHESQVFTRILEMPPLSDKELVQALRWEAERYIPLPLEEVNMDFAIMNKENERKKMDIAVVASPLRLIEKYVELFRNAGVHIEGLENESFSILRLFKDPNNNRMIIDLGNTKTGIYALRRGSLALARTVSTGGLALTKAILSELNVPHEQAEEYKKTYGVDASAMDGKLVNVLSPFLTSLVSEVAQSITFFKENYPDDVLYEILLIGGGSLMPGMATYFQDKLQIQTSIANPWFATTVPADIAGKYQTMASIFTIATGLATRNLEDKHEK